MKKLIILLIFLLILPVVNAQFNDELASNFVSEQTTPDIIEKSYQVLSLNFYDPTTADKIVTQIKAAGNNCWPTSCKVKETSLALMALTKRGEIIDTSWLLNQQIASTSGKWYLQISTSSKGSCKISYDNQDTIINVDSGELSTPLCKTKTTKLDISSCIKPNLLSNPSQKIIIDCEDLGSTPIISLLNQEGNTYYIIDKAIESQKLTLYINNGYFKTIEDTLFANWFLSDTNNKINSIVWLKKNYDKNNVVHNSLMYLITSDKTYLYSLIELQDLTTGSFGNTYDTAIATLALARSGEFNTALENARDFLGNKQLSDGSIENSLLYTAITLYSYSITKPTEKPPEYPTAPTPEQPFEEPREICMVNGICEREYGENEYNCPEDCKKEVIEEEEKVIPYVQPKKRSKAIWWLLIFFILILILAYIYYTQFYKKGKKLFVFKKKKKPERPTPKPLLPRKPLPRKVIVPLYKTKKVKKSKIEEELEKSLEEARKLLRKK